MQQHHTEAIRLTEHLLSRIAALSGAATGISSAAHQHAITADEIYQLLDVVADDLARSARQLLAHLTVPAANG